MIEKFFRDKEPIIIGISTLGGIFGGYCFATNKFRENNKDTELSLTNYAAYTIGVSLCSIIGGTFCYGVSNVALFFPIISVIYIPLTFTTYYLSHKYPKQN
jgi:nitrate/nitrite transporter NarK